MSNKNKFLVINCENSAKWSPIGFGEMFVSSLRCDGDEWDILELAKGEALVEDIDKYQGIVITGSRFNTRDKDTLPWFDGLCRLIRYCAEQGSPRMYGGCFGCQIIAVALGGRVDYNHSNRFVLKAESITPIEPSFSEILKPDEYKNSYKIIESHGDCVHELPNGAILLACSETCPHEIYVAGRCRNILAAQSHPEFQLKYAIEDRIWPSVVDLNKRLSGDEILLAKKSFETYSDDLDPSSLKKIITKFLHGDV